MPLFTHNRPDTISDFRWEIYSNRPAYFINRHFETIIPSVFYQSNGFLFDRERMELADGDFIDIDWLRQGSDKLVILCHGLEGGTDRYYVRRSARYFHQNGFDVLAWNNRSCSGEMNRLPQLYHHGNIEDLTAVVNHALSGSYRSILLIGFSMGGSHVSKFLSVSSDLDPRIRGGVAFSVSCDMPDSISEVEKPANFIYRSRFMKKVIAKAKNIESRFPGTITHDLETIKTFAELTQHVTVPLNRDLNTIEDYYHSASPVNFLQDLKRPLLMVNASNDPLLGENCYPTDLAASSNDFYLYIPKYGGHLGFNYSSRMPSYMERISDVFRKEVLDI